MESGRKMGATFSVLIWILVWRLQLAFVFCQEGFLSLACGATRSFQDRSTGIKWTPDSSYINTGLISITNGNQSTALRYFPSSSSVRNLYCYDVVPPTSGPQLTRATFIYENYDKLSKPPSFQFVLNQTVVSNIDLSSRDPWVEEAIFVGQTSICLLGLFTGGSPVISFLEIRPVDKSAYGSVLKGTILQKQYRINCGELSRTLRYPADKQDRIWDIDSGFFPLESSTIAYSGSIGSIENAEAVPLSVLQTARVASKAGLSYVLKLPGGGNYILVAYFAMLVNSTLSASFDILLNGVTQQSQFLLPPSFISTSYSLAFNTTAGTTATTLNFTLQGSSEINAVEVYKVINFVAATSDTDVGTLKSIQSVYNLLLDWKYDPCLPIPWKGIECTSSAAPEVSFLDLAGKKLEGTLIPTFGDFSELTNLNLSNNKLVGRIPDEMWALLAIESLDLSFNGLIGVLPKRMPFQNLKIMNLQNNNLTGQIPESLGQLSNLQIVNVMNNNFSGLIPDSLDGKIQWSGNICLGMIGTECFQSTPPSPSPDTVRTSQTTSDGSKKKTGVVAGVTVAALLGILLVFMIFVSLYRRSSFYKTAFAQPPNIRTDPKVLGNCKEFTYKELSLATNSFRTEIGKGSFGPVYYGNLQDGHEVAIKLRSDASQFGADAFINEVSLLSRVHHQNLVSLVGFCQKWKKQLLVYEYMAGGTLSDNLYGSRSRTNSLDWNHRLCLVIGAALGLDYLHNGSDPKVIHRDVKSNNILLDSTGTAKVSDFGLSKHVTRVDATHVTTMVKGTAGYLDPEYYASNQLTEKSDVYSFGVVLLEVICGREPLSDKCPIDEYSIISWAKPYIMTGDYAAVVDKKLFGKFEMKSMEIVSTVACRCVERNPTERPSMSEVVRELRDAIAAQNSTQ